jgi:amidophosphoribosyltransferase
MGGLVGMIFGKKRRTPEEREHLKAIFTRVLLASEELGPFASGIACVHTDGDYRIFKRPMGASRLVKQKGFRKVMDFVDDQTTILMGHTRRCMGEKLGNNANNHPMLIPPVLGTHLGLIHNTEEMFEHYGLPRVTEVDSELLFQMAVRSLEDGKINSRKFLEYIRPCHGEIVLVMVSLKDPENTFILKGNGSLEERVHVHHRVRMYAALDMVMEHAIQGERLWHKVRTPYMSTFIHRHEDIRRLPAGRGFIEFEMDPGWPWDEYEEREKARQEARDRLRSKREEK